MKDVFFDVLGNGNIQKNGCIYIKNGQRMTKKSAIVTLRQRRVETYTHKE